MGASDSDVKNRVNRTIETDHAQMSSLFKVDQLLDIKTTSSRDTDENERRLSSVSLEDEFQFVPSSKAVQIESAALSTSNGAHLAALYLTNNCIVLQATTSSHQTPLLACLPWLVSTLRERTLVVRVCRSLAGRIGSHAMLRYAGS